MTGTSKYMLGATTMYASTSNGFRPVERHETDDRVFIAGPENEVIQEMKRILDERAALITVINQQLMQQKRKAAEYQIMASQARAENARMSKFLVQPETICNGVNRMLKRRGAKIRLQRTGSVGELTAQLAELLWFVERENPDVDFTEMD